MMYKGTTEGEALMETAIVLFTFFICYFFIITEKINRALIACGGGLVLLLSGIYDIDVVFVEYIDWKTIGLLFSMMVLVSITSQTGVFEYVAIKVAQSVQGKPIPLLVVVATLTAIGSAFLDNVTTVLLFVPILLTITRLIEVPPVPYLITLIISSNIGGTATLIGDPPNIMIGQAVKHLTFNAFLVNLAPVVVIIFVMVIIGLTLVYKKELSASPLKQNKIMNLNASDFIKVSPALYKSVTVLFLTILGFILHPFLHIDLTSVAMSGALLLMLLTSEEQDVEEIFKSVEWVTLFFFMGLFMLIGGLEKVGIIDEFAKGIIYYTEGDLRKTALLILWTSGVFSGFVDNIPFVAAMIPVINEFQTYGMVNIDPLWWSLALGACLGGNATLIGASANVVVAGLALREKEPVHFMEFIKIGVPVVFISLIIATTYVYFKFLIYF
jgi:Na+/H+ antiporter NhaD/arsenite permease-like protein